MTRNGFAMNWTKTDTPHAITHYGAGPIKDDIQTVIKNHKTFGCNLIGIGSMPPAADGTRDYDWFAAQYRPAAQKIAAAAISTI